MLLSTTPYMMVRGLYIERENDTSLPVVKEFLFLLKNFNYLYYNYYLIIVIGTAVPSEIKIIRLPGKSRLCIGSKKPPS